MKTQIATTIDQSRRLIARGVNPDSADMCYLYFNQDRGQISRKEYLRLYCETLTDCRVELIPKDFVDCNYRDNDSPAWSLSRLLALLPIEINDKGLQTKMQLEPCLNEDEEDDPRWVVSYYDYYTDANLCYNEASDPIEACVKTAEWLTKNGYKLNEIKQ